MDDVQEQQPPEVLTSDTENHTQIHPSDAPPEKREKFERFRAYNTGLWNGPERADKEVLHQQDDLHLYDAIASKLDLTPYQRKRGRVLADRLSLDSFTSPRGQRDSKAVMFAFCVAVANDDVDGTRFWPTPNTEDNDAAFQDVWEEIDTDWEDMVSLIQRVDHKLG